MHEIYVGAIVLVVSPQTDARYVPALVSWCDPMSGLIDAIAFEGNVNLTAVRLQGLRESYAGYASHCWRFADPERHAEEVALHKAGGLEVSGGVAG